MSARVRLRRIAQPSMSPKLGDQWFSSPRFSGVFYVLVSVTGSSNQQIVDIRQISMPITNLRKLAEECKQYTEFVWLLELVDRGIYPPQISTLFTI